MTDSQAAHIGFGTGAADWRYRCVECGSTSLRLRTEKGGWYCRRCGQFYAVRYDSRNDREETHPKRAGAPAQDTAPVRQRGESDG